MTSEKSIVPRWVVGEFVGTFLLVFFGCGSVAAAVLLGAQVGVYQVAIVWGLGIGIAIHLTGSLSGAHLNAAVTVGLATWADFPWKRVPGYIVVQFLGAFTASAALYAMFCGPLAAYEAAHHLVRGAPGSEASAMIFGEYFPNPGGQPLTAASRALVSFPEAFFAEVVGTAILLLVILCATDERNASRPAAYAPMIIGLTITVLISLIGPLTMACFNPGRDFAPRVFSALAGWGSIPFTTNGTGWLTVYILAPVFGGLLGGAIYRKLFRPNFVPASA